MNKLVIAIIVLLLVLLGIWYALSHKAAPVNTPEAPTATVAFSCTGGTNITAAFFAGSSTPAVASGEMPKVTGHVELSVNGAATTSLPQTISADGARYAAANDAMVFWERGNTAMWMPSQGAAVASCVAVASNRGSLPNVYASTTAFSLRYPANFTVKENYVYQALGPGKTIPGVSFIIDPSIATGTNLASDTYLSVEHRTVAGDCSALVFLDGVKQATTVTEGDTTYSFASTTGAAAGNRYEETVYALPGTNPCTAVRYLIHYGVFENYPAGSVTAFDEGALKATFDAMRRTLFLAH